MARAAATAVENNFSKGLITEATGLNAPENSAQDTYDCVYKTTGEVKRRNGFETEANGVFQTVTSDVSAVAEYVWNNAANLGQFALVVQQVGITLYFFRVTSSGALSDGMLASTVSLSTFAIGGAPISPAEGVVCQFDSGNGRLFVTHPYCQPFYVEYNFGLDTVAATGIDIKIRDFKRLDDDLAESERPSTLTTNHQYNLYSQGWYLTAATASGNQNVMNYFKSGIGTYPSNADVWWTFKNSDELMDNGQVYKINRGNSLAPNGHYVVDAFEINRQSVSGISGVESESAVYNRPVTNAFAFGRAFFGGVRANGFGDKIYFSPVIENIDQVGKCYQQQDPTSEDNSDLLPTDGGVIVIPGMGNLLKLYPLGSSVFAFASNGVWQIGGGQGGFTANDYSVRKISIQMAAGPMSFVEAEGRVFWWNVNGIYMIAPSEINDVYSVTSITDQTIKSFIQEIPAANITYVKGAYDPLEQVIQWLFRSSTAATVSEHFQYNRVLNLRLPTQAFYPWTISTVTQLATAPEVSGILCTSGFGIATSNETVVVSAGDTVVIT